MSEKRQTLAGTGSSIQTFLRAVIERAHFQVDFQVVEGETRHPDFENPEIVVKFSGPDVELLLANKAEVLLALEQLTMEALGLPPERHSTLCFDANDYRMLRVEELRLSALTAADRVKRTGAPFPFNPMNSRERRIIHLALRGETAVRSESAGMGPQRQVVIYPANMPAQPLGAAPAFTRPPARRGRRR